MHHGLRYPLFVKPACAGSSFGVTRVETPDALPAAVAEAFPPRRQGAGGAGGAGL